MADGDTEELAEGGELGVFVGSLDGDAVGYADGEALGSLVG